MKSRSRRKSVSMSRIRVTVTCGDPVSTWIASPSVRADRCSGERVRVDVAEHPLLDPRSTMRRRRSASGRRSRCGPGGARAGASPRPRTAPRRSTRPGRRRARGSCRSISLSSCSRASVSCWSSAGLAREGLLDAVAQRLDEHVPLAREVVVHGAGAGAAGPGDVGDADLVIAALGDQPPRRPKDLELAGVVHPSTIAANLTRQSDRFRGSSGLLTRIEATTLSISH